MLSRCWGQEAEKLFNTLGRIYIGIPEARVEYASQRNRRQPMSSACIAPGASQIFARHHKADTDDYSIGGICQAAVKYVYEMRVLFLYLFILI